MGSDEEARANPVAEWIEGHLIASVFIAIGFLVVVGLLLSSLGGDDPGEGLTASGSTIVSGPTTTTQDPNRPEVPQVDCSTLLTSDEVDEALFGEEVSGPRGFLTFAQGETCLHEADDESGKYIRIEPGDPGDFEAGAQLSGVFAESVNGVGDGARWFDNDSDLGVLSVGVNIDDASIIYRIHIGRSDLDRAQRLEQATQLALAALPRFPGTDPGPPEPLVDLCEMVSDGQAEQILAAYRDAHPATRDEILVTDNFSEPVDLSEEGDANCSKLILAEIYIEAQQGSVSDFEAGADFEGIPGEAVDGVGDEALWFADVPYQGSFSAPHERGVLAVKVGDAYFRIAVAFPDTPSDEQLEIVTALATGAIRQIPGAPEQSPETVTFDEEGVDVPPRSLDDVLNEGVEAGEWTLGEGLAALLDWMLNDTPGVVDDDLAVTSASGVIAAAQSYLADEPEDADVVRSLLDELLLTSEELDARAAPASSSASSLTVSAVPIAQEAPPLEDCPGTADEPCYTKLGLDEFADLEPGRYFVYVASPSSWTETEVALAKGVLHDAVVRFGESGTMPPTGLVLRPGDQLYASYVPEVDCLAYIGDFLVGADPDDMRQILAREVAFCFISHDLFDQLWENPSPVNWMVLGLANYLSGVVYPTNDLEHENLPDQLAQQELATTMPGRTWTNWIFFEHLHAFVGADGIMAMLRAFPQGGELTAALAGAPGVDELYHDLERALSDANVSDVGQGTVPYDPQAWEVPLSGPTEIPLTVPPFGVRRLHLTVPPGEYACVEFFEQGPVRMSWRPGSPGDPGSWSDELPDSFQGEVVMVLSAVEGGANYTLDVVDVSTEEDCEEEEENPGGGDVTGPILGQCEDMCDPSTYYWGPLSFA